MNKKSNFSPEEEKLFSRIKHLVAQGALDPKYEPIIIAFYENYKNAIVLSKQAHIDYADIFHTFVKRIESHCNSSPHFENYHQKIRTPFDYYRFGLDFMRPLVDRQNSSVNGLENVEKMIDQISRGENVVLLANHQTESDPQLISILLESSFARFAEKMIFVAGERVITDPLAIPFSLGCDLLCIYSKRYIDHFADKKRERLLHNQKTMQVMKDLLQSGGQLIYVAPSGGRDRLNSKGVVEVAHFDPASIEMFYLMSKKAKTPTHFYPLTLVTYEVLPPPERLQKELGEKRAAKFSPIHIHFGPEIDMQHFPGCDIKNKLKNRENRARYICDLVKKQYSLLTNS